MNINTMRKEIDRRFVDACPEDAPPEHLDLFIDWAGADLNRAAVTMAHLLEGMTILVGQLAQDKTWLTYLTEISRSAPVPAWRVLQALERVTPADPAVLARELPGLLEEFVAAGCPQLVLPSIILAAAVMADHLQGWLRYQPAA